MVTLIALNLLVVFLLVAAVAHGNWFGVVSALFFLALLWLWVMKKVDLGYAFRRPRVLAFVALGMAALYIVSEVLYGCAAVVSTEADRPVQPVLPRSEWLKQAAPQP